MAVKKHKVGSLVTYHELLDHGDASIDWSNCVVIRHGIDMHGVYTEIRLPDGRELKVNRADLL